MPRSARTRGVSPRSMPSESDILRRRHRREEFEAVRRDQVVRAGRAEDLTLARGLDVQVEQGPPEGGFGVQSRTSIVMMSLAFRPSGMTRG